jgi:hypothetical protein
MKISAGVIVASLAFWARDAEGRFLRTCKSLCHKDCGDNKVVVCKTVYMGSMIYEEKTLCMDKCTATKKDRGH